MTNRLQIYDFIFNIIYFLCLTSIDYEISLVQMDPSSTRAGSLQPLFKKSMGRPKISFMLKISHGGISVSSINFPINIYIYMAFGSDDQRSGSRSHPFSTSKRDRRHILEKDRFGGRPDRFFN